MKILNLKVENVKKIKVVEIAPNGNLVVVGGNNAQGKSSVLDSIWMAIGGKAASPDRPIRDGAQTGHIELEMDEDFVVRRNFFGDGTTTLEILNKLGAKYPTPQTILNGFCNKFSFDPLAFQSYDKKKQVEIVKNLAGVDTTQLEKEIKEKIEDRQFLKRDIDRLDKENEGKNYDISFAPQKVDTVAIQAQCQQALETEKTRSHYTQQAHIHRFNAEQAEKKIEEYTRAIETLKANIVQYRQTAAEIDAKLACLPPPVDIVLLNASMEKATLHNAECDNWLERKKKWDFMIQQKVQLEALEKEIANKEAEKKQIIASAKLPISGLSFTEDGLLFNGVPFEQCSSAERLKVSTAMGIALNPRLRVLLIRDGSLLDESNLRIVAEMAAKHDAQVWIERVGDGEECSVVMEDGLIKENRMVS